MKNFLKKIRNFFFKPKCELTPKGYYFKKYLTEISENGYNSEKAIERYDESLNKIIVGEYTMQQKATIMLMCMSYMGIGDI